VADGVPTPGRTYVSSPHGVADENRRTATKNEIRYRLRSVSVFLSSNASLSQAMTIMQSGLKCKCENTLSEESLDVYLVIDYNLTLKPPITTCVNL
jgi:hypothetical protein